MIFWYVLYVITGSEKKAVNEIDKVWKISEINPFIPERVDYFRKQGSELTEKNLLFPGYVFIETQISAIDFFTMTSRKIQRSKFMRRLLSYNNSYDYSDYSFAMREEERQTIQRICNNEFCVDMSQGFIEGNHVIITSGPLIGFESHIKKVNRHKRKAVLEIDIMGAKRDIIVGLEIIQKI